VASVFLNGHYVGYAENCYRSYRWNVNDALQEGENTLVVTFASPVNFARQKERERGYYPHQQNHPFNQLRKPSFSFGWDWGIDAVNCGIWKSMRIESWAGARITAVRPWVNVREDAGELTADIEIAFAGHGGADDLKSYLNDTSHIDGLVTLSGRGFKSTQRVRFDRKTLRTQTHFSVPAVEKWWPVGYGDHPLYDLSVSLSNGADTVATVQKRIGFRSVEIDKSADNVGRAFQIYVNGVRIHARGYNWIPDDAFISRISQERYQRGIADALESNSNMLRVWGGGLYESEVFYDLADQYGLMIWQDFMFACAAYPEDAQTKAEVEEEVREQVSRLSAHPSLIVWNGSNENYVAYADWPGYQEALKNNADGALSRHENGWGDYYYSQVIPEALADLDPTRIYLPSSPMSSASYVSPNVDTDGTMHIWDVWNSADYKKFLEYVPRFADEFGYQAPPAWRTLTEAVHDVPLTPFGSQMLVHQKANLGNEKLAKGMRSHITPGSFDDVNQDSSSVNSWIVPSDDWDDIEDWHWACQLQQAQAVRFGVEHMRSLEPTNAGILIWQLNDDWPVVSWAAVDYSGRRKPLWYASRKCFEPVFATIQPRVSEQKAQLHDWPGVGKITPDTLALVVVNDTQDDVAQDWLIERTRLDGTRLHSEKVSSHVGAFSQVTIPLSQGIASFKDPDDEVIVATPARAAEKSEEIERVIYNPSEVLTQKLQKNPFSATVERVGKGYILHVEAREYCRDLFCMADKVSPDSVVDDGLINMLPGERHDFFIASSEVSNAEEFASRSVLRCANDLKRQ
jgi:beta-mannosidase